ncbi:SMODS domain-containing nucleotidyltransferase [Deinococcus aquatilis]|uniref:SMODS domain-containing nucleotidyltransferase n=1 Tax=Deinococcus aquatilis TaxID=519440 RepID=UPI00035D2F6F|nr:nucleotidyltransferase [Deinococcus aquatilis]
MSVSQDFETLCNNLVIRNGALISSRYQSITARLNKDFHAIDSYVQNTIQVGSYGRDTAIVDAHDVDVLFKLPFSVYQQYNGYLSNGQSALLQAVRNSIQRTYPSTAVGGDGQVVVVSFADQMRFEVLPAFLNSDSISYTHADSNNGGSWKTTNPQAEINEIHRLNGLYNKNLKRLCRMARAWRRHCGVQLSGIQIDTLAAQFMASWGYKDKSYLYYDYLTRDFMKYLADQDKTQVYWRAPGSGSFVWRKGPFEAKAGAAYQAALEGTDLYAKNKTTAARGKFREIYGNNYPR